MPGFYVCTPHSFCSPDVEERHCDRVALMAANEIRKCDDKGRYIKSYLFSDKLRQVDHDYNRANTDDTPWRKQMMADITHMTPDFVLEVHSYPGAHEIYQKNWPEADMVLYMSEINKDWVGRLKLEILANSPANYNILIVKPWHPVAITDDIIKLRKELPPFKNVKHTLFEFNEDIPKKRTLDLARATYSAVTVICGYLAKDAELSRQNEQRIRRATSYILAKQRAK